jgi:DNA-binding NtrC family response regulator
LRHHTPHMDVIADRFGIERDRTIDLATGYVVRLEASADLSRAQVAERGALCDRLASLRHPLLVPLVDYGMWGGRWLEAHACGSSVRISAAPRHAALHLVRFLRQAGVELTAADAARHVRPAQHVRSGNVALLGSSLRWRAELDAVRLLLEASARPGVSAITISGSDGSGLRTARLQIARTARLAGFTVVDSRLASALGDKCHGRHVCVLEWLPTCLELPRVLACSDDLGSRRHVWVRFTREPYADAIALGPFTSSELNMMVYRDTDFGPSAGAVGRALLASRGTPGAFIRALTTTHKSAAVMRVHEASAEYIVAPRVPVVSAPQVARAGVARLERAVDAAIAIGRRGRHTRAERVLRRVISSLAARGARDGAARAACELGDVHLRRERPGRAIEAFTQARKCAEDERLRRRALIGLARALRDSGGLIDAEGTLRTLAAAPLECEEKAAVSRMLAEIEYLRGRLDAAEAFISSEWREADSGAMLSTIRQARGDLAGAAHAAGQAIARADAGDLDGRCLAHLAAARVQAVLEDVDGVRREIDIARRCARSTHRPWLRLRVSAEEAACLARCGVPVTAVRRARLLAACGRLAPLHGAELRAMLGERGDELRRFVEASGAAILQNNASGGADPIAHFQSLVDAIHGTTDELSALHAIAEDTLTTLEACSVAIRSIRLGRVVASAGRAWPGEPAFTQSVLDGGCSLRRQNGAPEAGEPIRIAGETLGAIAVRWIPAGGAPASRVSDVLRVAAIAAAPILRSCTDAPPAPETGSAEDLLGRGPAADRLREAIRRAAMAPYPVLIQGESGSGKELVARAIHGRSPRRTRRWCAVNCAALTDDLLEAELFGHVRGAFTGAVAERAGLFEDADQGTLFLDEVAELSGRAQAKLLRVLQEGEVRRIGENLPRRIDTRVVAATNRSIEADVDAGRFRADLRFRLDVVRIEIPPLRARADEIPSLVERIWQETAARVGTRATLGVETIAALTRYEWPGNVRELQNVLASIAVHAPRRGSIGAAILPAHFAASAATPSGGFDAARLDFERRFVRAALARAGGRRARAAVQLGVSRQGLAKMIKRLGIEA